MDMGRYILGDTIGLSCWCRDSSATPTEPDQAPVAVITSESAHVTTLRLPIHDRYGVTGYFHLPLVLDNRFAAGQYVVTYQYVVGGTAGGDVSTFEIVGGGHTDGPGIGLFYYRRPTSDYCLIQTDGGRIIRRRNPRL